MNIEQLQKSVEQLLRLRPQPRLVTGSAAIVSALNPGRVSRRVLLGLGPATKSVQQSSSQSHRNCI
jgi:hypothetical protein